MIYARETESLTLPLFRGFLLGVILLSGILVTPSFVGGTSVAHAQECAGLDENGKPCPDTSATAAPSATTATPPTDAGGGSGAGTMAGGEWDGVMGFLMSLFAALTGAAGVTLDYAAYYTVVHMGDVVGNTSGLTAIGIAWHIVRDLGNIVLIFGFLAVGICTILEVDWYGGGTKMLPKLLIAAVFINFSFFISEAVIDVGNLFATQFYTQIKGGSLQDPSTGGVAGVWDAIKQDGISNKIMSQLGLQRLYGDAITNPNVFSNGHVSIIGFFAILLFIISAFVMFSLAIMLISRFVILVFLIIVAPIGFAGYAVPKLEGIAKLWWDTLIQQTLTAPVLLLLLYVALRVITDAHFLTGFGSQGGDSWTGWITGASGGVGNFAGAILSFLIAMGLLLACIIVSKRMGAFGAATATAWGGKLSFGLTGFLGRNTIGRTSHYISRGIGNTWVGNTELGRYSRKLFDYGAKASFDVRATKTWKNYSGVDAGDAQKGGYLHEVDAKKKAQVAYGKSLSSTNSKPYIAADTKHKEAIAEEVKAKAEEAKTKAELEQLEARRKALGYINPDLNREIEEKTRLVEEKAGLTKTATANVTAAADTLKNTPKNAQAAYARRLENPVLGTGPARATGYLSAGATGAATGAAVLGLAGPAGIAVGAIGGAGLGAWLAHRQAVSSAASAQAAKAVSKRATMTEKEKFVEEVAELLKDEKEDKGKPKEGGKPAEKPSGASAPKSGGGGGGHH